TLAPIFHARTIPGKWRDSGGGGFDPEHFAAFGNRIVAFCRLGNPHSFWNTLERLGIKPLAGYEYDDHHQYTPSEIRRLAGHARDMGADVLLTTAKDAINLDPDYQAIIGNIWLCWLEIRIEIDRTEELLDLMASAVRLEA